MENNGFVQKYLSEARTVIESISTDDVDKSIGLLFEAWKNDNRVFICGNGGSASTATHFACDMAKTTILPGKKRFKVECINDNVPLMLALINDDGFDNLFCEQLKSKFQKGDILI